LGMCRAASQSELRKAYHMQALRTHPDKGGNPVAFHKVHAAFEVLSDTQRRMAYDQHLQASGSQDGLNEGTAHVVDSQVPELINLVLARKLHVKLLTIPEHLWHQEVAAVSSATIEALVGWMRPKAQQKRAGTARKVGIPQSFQRSGLRVSPNGSMTNEIEFDNVCIRTVGGTEDFGLAVKRYACLTAIRESWRRKPKEEQKMGLASADLECGFEEEPTICLSFRLKWWRGRKLGRTYTRSPWTQDPRQFQPWHRSLLQIDTAQPHADKKLGELMREAFRSVSKSRDTLQLLQATIRSTLEEVLRVRASPPLAAPTQLPALPSLSPLLGGALWDAKKDAANPGLKQLRDLPAEQRASLREVVLRASKCIWSIHRLPDIQKRAVMQFLPTLSLCRVVSASRGLQQMVVPALEKRISIFIDTFTGLEDEVRCERARRAIRRHLMQVRRAQQLQHQQQTE